MRSPFSTGSRTRRACARPRRCFSQRLDPEFAEAGRDPAVVLDYVGDCIDQPGIATTSPRFMGYIPGGGLFHSALGDMLAAASNKYSGFALGQRPARCGSRMPAPPGWPSVIGFRPRPPAR